jgi:chromosome segregation ATPase
LADAESKLSVSAEALAEHKDRARALALHDPNPGIIQALENKLDEANAVTTALQAAASAAAEEAAERKSDAERADASLAAARETIEKLESKVRHLEGALAQSEASCLLHATELEQTRWREAAAGTHAAHAEEKLKELRDASAELERRADVAQRASLRDAGRLEAAEAALTRADDRARLAFEEKEKLAEEARIARAAAAAAALELRSIASDLAAAKATAAAQSARADDAEARAKASDERFESLRRESSAAASRARDTSVALREAREKSAVLSTQVTAGETLVKQLEARLKQLEKRVKIAERAAKQTDALATRDAENKKTLAETGSALAERAEMIVADATRKAEAARKAEATAKETLAEQTSLLKRRHAEQIEKKDSIVANVVAACKQEEAVREEAAARATKAEARARAAESALERARVDLRDAEEARRDAELAAERHERKSKTYRDENETLVLKYDRAMRQLANAADEHIGLGSLDDRGNRGGPRRASGKSARARAAASDSGGGGESEGESRREKT